MNINIKCIKFHICGENCIFEIYGGEILPDLPFDELCEKILKINDIANSVPHEFKSEVFSRLYNSLDSPDQSSVYIDTIRKLENEQNRRISDIADLTLIKSNIDKALLFVYYLEQFEDLKITFEYVNACFSMFGFVNPQLRQTLRDLTNPNKYGYLEFVNNAYVTTDIGKEILQSKKFFMEKKVG